MGLSREGGEQLTSLEEQLETQLFVAKGEKRKAEAARQLAVEEVYRTYKAVAQEMISQAKQSLANARRSEALANIKYRQLHEKLELNEGPFPNNPPVLGIRIGGIPKAYPFPIIAEKGVINDIVAVNNILVTLDPDLLAGAVFYRTVQSLTLSFHTTGHREDGLMLVQDQETGSVWQALTGRAIKGPLTGIVLEEISSDFSTVAQWKELYPGTEFAK